MKSLKIITVIAMFTALAAQAESKGGLFVEPMLTYESGSSDVSFPAPIGSSESDISGFGVGARLGFHVQEAVFLGLDGRYSMLNYENSDTNINTDAKALNWGPVIGVQVPSTLGIRLWAGYIMGGEMDLEKDQGLDLKFKDARGYRIGAGIKLAAVSLNLEYQDLTYGKTELENSGLFSGNTSDVDSDNDSLILSVSFPVSL